VPFALFYIVPIAYAIYQSMLVVERTGGIFGGSTSRFGGLDQYVAIITDASFTTALLRIVIYTAIQVPLMVIVAVTIALLLDGVPQRLAKVYRTVYFMPYAVPGVVAALMWGSLYLPSMSPLADLGVHIDFLSAELVLPSIANAGVWAYTGLNVILMVAALTSIPRELLESGRIDGASSLQLALKIKLPLIKSTIVIAVLLNTIGTVQLFTEPKVFQSITDSITSDYTPNLLAYSAAANNNFSYAAAVSVVLALVTFAISVVFIRGVLKRGTS
jgi:multiple sugar transport system permease protein